MCVIIVTNVVDVKVLRYGSVPCLIGNPMSANRFTINPNVAVPLSIQLSLIKEAFTNSFVPME